MGLFSAKVDRVTDTHVWIYDEAGAPCPGVVLRVEERKGHGPELDEPFRHVVDVRTGVDGRAILPRLRVCRFTLPIPHGEAPRSSMQRVFPGAVGVTCARAVHFRLGDDGAPRLALRFVNDLDEYRDAHALSGRCARTTEQLAASEAFLAGPLDGIGARVRARLLAAAARLGMTAHAVADILLLEGERDEANACRIELRLVDADGRAPPGWG